MNENTRCPRHLGIAPNPGEIIAALPYLVGFPPVDSMVAVLLDSEGCLQMTARHDWEAIVAEPAQSAANLVGCAQRCGCSSIALIALGPTRAPETQESTLVDFAGVLDQCGDGEVEIRWAVHSEADRWWSADCQRTCGPRSHRVPSRADSKLAQRLRAEGCEPAKNRHQIMSEFDPASEAEVTAVEHAVRRLTPTATDPAETLALKSSIVDRVELLLLADSAMSPEDIATLAVACQDIRMRDSVLWRFTKFASTDSKIWRRVWPRISEALASVPDSHVAAVASVAGLFAWLKGDGIRSQAALDRALKGDPNHNLARLVHQAVAGGVPPSVWVSAMSDLTEMDCMNGRGETVGRREDTEAA